jgi:excisionase family DNA binding protein
MSSPEKLLTVAEVAEMLKVSLRWVYDHASSGDLQSVKIGNDTRKLIRFRPSVIAAYQSNQETK